MWPFKSSTPHYGENCKHNLPQENFHIETIKDTEDIEKILDECIKNNKLTLEDLHKIKWVGMKLNLEYVGVGMKLSDLDKELQVERSVESLLTFVNKQAERITNLEMELDKVKRYSEYETESMDYLIQVLETREEMHNIGKEFYELVISKARKKEDKNDEIKGQPGPTGENKTTSDQSVPSETENFKPSRVGIKKQPKRK